MPIYQYTCEFGHLKEEYQSIKDFDKNRVVVCDECGNNMESYIGSPPLGFVQNITTVGQLGEKNWKELGKVRQQEQIGKQKEAKEAAAKEIGISNDVRKARKLANLTKDQRRKYIQTGKLPP